jgi:hypothetical protein
MHHNHIRSGGFINAVARNLFDSYFVGYGLAWLFIHLFRLLNDPVPFFNGWLTDFCFVPLVCHTALTFTRFVIIRDETYCYPLSFVLFVAVYGTVFFEMIVPRYSGYGIGDVWDGVVYFSGAAFFYFIHQKRNFLV